MTEWLREGIEGRSLKATLRLYLLGLMALAPASALLALAFGGHASFVATPVLVLILIAVELAFCYRAKLRKGFEDLVWELRRSIINKQYFREGGPRIDQRRYVSEVSRKASFVDLVDVILAHRPLELRVQDVLHDTETSVRVSAAFALGVIGDPRAVDPLIGALQDQDSPVRAAAAEALMRIGDVRAIAPLISAMSDQDASVRLAVAEALWQMTSSPAVQANLGREAVENVRRLVTINEPERALPKNEEVKTAIESVRKRA